MRILRGVRIYPIYRGKFGHYNWLGFSSSVHPLIIKICNYLPLSVVVRLFVFYFHLSNWAFSSELVLLAFIIPSLLHYTTHVARSLCGDKNCGLREHRGPSAGEPWLFFVTLFSFLYTILTSTKRDASAVENLGSPRFWETDKTRTDTICCWYSNRSQKDKDFPVILRNDGIVWPWGIMIY